MGIDIQMSRLVMNLETNESLVSRDNHSQMEAEDWQMAPFKPPV
jgi:hypothetical protein